jgi:spore coat protein U-like protein
MKRTMLMMIMLALIMSAGTAMAATDTSNLDVLVTVQNMCRITSTTDVDFGTYDPTDPADDTDGVGDIKFRCTKGANYGIYIVRTNTMTDGTDNLTYALYTDVARTSVFPSSSVGTPDTSVSNAVATKNIYGKITAQQDVQAGNYSETVTATIEY